MAQLTMQRLLKNEIMKLRLWKFTQKLISRLLPMLSGVKIKLNVAINFTLSVQIVYLSPEG